ncbi:MAG TPA: DUF2490 domain-containing protein [Salinimicrobium sp.]|nr:DUF2490 domain-containing protein [Salinimicrobium sp.]
MKSIKSYFVLIVLLLSHTFVFAQHPHSFFGEFEFELEIPTETKFSFEVEAGARGLFLETYDGEKSTDYTHQHFEITQFTKYQHTEAIEFALGLRYRMKEPFDDGDPDEKRIIEEIEYEPVNSTIGLSHRGRLEQRFRGEEFIFRLRYQIGASKPLNETFSLGVSTEALYGVSTIDKPEPEQRFAIELENSGFKNVELGVGFEVRLENYVLDLGYEYFFATKVKISL